MAIAQQAAVRETIHHYAPAILAIAGWLALFGPVYIDYAGGAWTREENGHAPFLLAICAGAAWAILTGKTSFSLASKAEFVVGVIMLVAGLSVYAIGRAGEIDVMTSAAQLPIAVGVVVSVFGWRGARRLWFPLAMLFYLIVWPGWAIDAATAPLKRFVSASVSEMLFASGLPVAHTGAIISAGPYELLVADACAGLNSLIALTAVGAVYLYVARRQSWKTNLAVVLAMAPIAILANILRVALLVLITYYWGYDAGQSFLHETAGLLMFAIALLGVFVVDAVAARIWERRS